MSPDNNRPAVIGIFRHRPPADNCFKALLSRGYLSSDINIMMTERTRKEHYLLQKGDAGSVVIDGLDGNPSTANDGHSGSADGSGRMKTGAKAVGGDGVGRNVGSSVGATLAAIASVGTSLVIPGLNLVVAGPIGTNITGTGTGSLTGGFVGFLVRAGVPKQDADTYYRALQEGALVMSVETPSNNSQQIKELMIDHSGEQVCCCNS